MLIIPLEKSIDWHKPPVFTFLIIIINTVVLFFTQAQDDEILNNSLKYYLSSQLPIIELPLYLKTQPHIFKGLRDEQVVSMIENKEANEKMIVSIFVSMERNARFMKKLHNNEVINAQNKDYTLWKKSRTHFEDLRHSAPSYQYGFTPSKHEPITFITHQFLHSGYDHLIGNMIFLFLIGFTLETALGSLLYFACYLISGLGSVLLYWLVYSNSDIVLVGASGAISGLMGMYAGVFGFRKIRFFYSLLFYFDFIKAPALIMLPLWIANEVYQLFFTTGSHVAYVAHLGGLLTGGLISFAIKHYFNEKIDAQYLNISVQQDERNMLYEQGMKFLRELKIPQAQKMFSSLYAKYPNDTDILMQYYKTLKYTPENHEYNAVIAKIFENADDYNVKQTNDVFKDYIKLRRSVTVSSKTLVKLALLFSKSNNQTEAEIIVETLLKKSPNIERLDQALLALATAWQRQGNSEKYMHCLNLLIKYYPTQPISVNANLLLDRLNNKR